jgi:hypothetical protein
MVGLVWYGVVTFYSASGFRHYASGVFADMGANGCHWSCAVTAANAYAQFFFMTASRPMYSGYRAIGFSVRCVQNLPHRG